MQQPEKLLAAVHFPPLDCTGSTDPQHRLSLKDLKNEVNIARRQQNAATNQNRWMLVYC